MAEMRGRGGPRHMAELGEELVTEAPVKRCEAIHICPFRPLPPQQKCRAWAAPL